MIGGMFSSSIAAYAFAKLKFKLKNIMFAIQYGFRLKESVRTFETT
jgi:ABC-type glycerol-3-phosphate transport system permease component